MQFSVTTTEKSGILQHCERYTRLGDATITGTASTLAEFTNYCNIVSRKVWHTIFKAYGGWQYDDGNQTDLPAATTTLTTDQTSYALPSSSLTVRGIEVKDTGGIWKRLLPITEEQIRDRIAMGEFLKTSAQPLFYQLVGQSVRIFPAANYTQSASFKVFFDRGSVAFLTTDTTATPGFASEYHDVIPVGASVLWYEINSPEDMTLIGVRTRMGSIGGLRGTFEDKLNDIRDFYQMKFSQMFPPNMKVRDEMREAM